MFKIIGSARDGDWLTAERLTAYALLLLGGYALNEIWLFYHANGMLDSLGRPLGTDFANVWSSGRLALEGRPEAALDPHLLKPYQQALFAMGDRFYGWHYPPMFLGPAALLAMLPYVSALIVWLVVTGAFYLICMHAIMTDAEIAGWRVVAVAMAYPAAFCCITHGQNGFLTAALIGGGLAAMPVRPIAAGVLFGLLAYKPQYGLLLPIALVISGNGRTILSALGTVIVTVALSIAAFGWKSWTTFTEFLSFTRETVLEQGGPGWSKMQGVFPAVRMLGGSIEFAYALQSITVALLVGAVAWLWRSQANDHQKAAGLILATTLATPYAFNYDTVVLGPAIAFLVVDGIRRGFAPFEKSILAALWAAPLVSREVTELTAIPIATLVTLLAFAALLHKVAGVGATLSRALDVSPTGDAVRWIRHREA